MLPPQISRQIGDEILAAAMSARITAETKEDRMRQLLRALLPYMKTVSAHTLTAAYVEALFKLRMAHQMTGKKAIHIHDDMYAVKGDCPYRLSTLQWSNFSKLRFWGFAVHAEKERRNSGLWLLTPNGAAFLSGERVAPKKVWSFRSHPIHPKEPIPGQRLIHVTEYKRELPRYESYTAITPRTSTPAPTQQLFV